MLMAKGSRTCLRLRIIAYLSYGFWRPRRYKELFSLDSRLLASFPVAEGFSRIDARKQETAGETYGITKAKKHQTQRQGGDGNFGSARAVFPGERGRGARGPDRRGPLARGFERREPERGNFAQREPRRSGFAKSETAGSGPFRGDSAQSRPAQCGSDGGNSTGRRPDGGAGQRD